MLPLTAKDKLQGVERFLQKHLIIVILINPFTYSTLPLFSGRFVASLPYH
jgi:hypothetical protein